MSCAALFLSKRDGQAEDELIVFFHLLFIRLRTDPGFCLMCVAVEVLMEF